MPPARYREQRNEATSDSKARNEAGWGGMRSEATIPAPTRYKGIASRLSSAG
jgi:hypothetical protein